MPLLLHAPGRAAAGEAAFVAPRLAAALGAEVHPRPYAAGERAAVAAGEGPAGAWALLAEADLLPAPPPEEAAVILPRRDPRWALEDLLKRPLEGLPPGTGVVVPTDLGAALLHRARPDLRPVRAGSFPTPEETPVLAEGPFSGLPAAEPLDLRAFPPAPGTGARALRPPPGDAIPPSVATAADGAAAAVLRIEAAFLRGLGEGPAGEALALHVRPRAPILFALEAHLFRAGRPPARLAADIPLGDAAAFALRFGRHLRERPA